MPKSFDLQKALAGKPVITRNGEKVLELHYFESFPSKQKLKGFLEGEDFIRSWDDDGCWGGVSAPESNEDLFMADPEQKKYWMNVYKDNVGTVYGSDFYKSRQEAIDLKGSSNYIKTIEITLDETE